MTVPNRITLISRGRKEEAHNDAAVYPGMLVQKNSSGNIIPHAVVNGAGAIAVVEENALVGGNITQVIATGQDGIGYRLAAKGDLLLMLLQNGQSVTNQGYLNSAGDGTLQVAPGGNPTGLYNITAPSTGITNTATETAFSNGSYNIPANSLKVGDVIHIRGRAVVSAQNSTNTHRVKVEFLAAHTIIADSTAIAAAAADFVEWDIDITIRTIGASGTYVYSGFITYSLAGTPTEVPLSGASATIDTTVAENIRVTSTASAASTGNVIALQELQIQSINSSQGGLVIAQETVDNSGGTGTSGFNTAAFVRVLIP